MTIDGNKVSANAAYTFNAIGGGFGVKVKLIPEKRGDFLFGAFTEKKVADALAEVVKRANGAKESSDLVSAAYISARAKRPSLPVASGAAGE